MQYWDLYRLLRKHRVFVIGMVLLAVVIAAAIMYIYPVYPKVVYASSARLVVTPPGFEVTQLSSEQRPWYFAVNQDEVFTTTVAELVSSDAVLDRAAVAIDDPAQEKAVRATLEAEAVKAPTLGLEMFTRIIEVRSLASTPEDAKSNTDNAVDAFLEFYDDASSQQAADEKARIETELTNAKTRYSEAQSLTTAFEEKHGIVDIDHQAQILAEQYQEISHELKSTQTGFTNFSSSRERGLEKLLDQTRAEIEALPGLQAEHAALMVAESATQDAYSVLEVKLAEATVAQSINAAAGQVDVVDYGDEAELPANYIRLIKSADWFPAFDYRKAVVLVAVLLTSALLAVGLVIGARRVDNRIRDASDAARVSGLSVLGVIPVSDRPTATVTDTSSSAYAEAYRTLQAQITRHVAASADTQVLAVVSASTAEGRTSVTYNLGHVLAEAGMRVALVDADLHGRDLTRLVSGADADAGIIAAITSENPSDQEQLTEAAPSLWVLEAEEPTSSTVSLFSGDGFVRVLDQLRSHYDVVLVDTPPALAFADSAFIARECDGAIFVMRAGTPQRGAFEAALDQLREAGTTFVGTVVVAVEDDDYEGSYHYTQYVQERRGDQSADRDAPDDSA